jgi:protein ImuB
LHSVPPPDPYSLIATPLSLLPKPLYACVYHPPVADAAASPSGTLVALAEQFSPRYERHRDDLVSIDVSGLEQLLGPARAIGEELRREAAARGIRAHVAVAITRMAALVLALARPGLTVVPTGTEAEALAPLPIALLEKVDDDRTQSSQGTQRDLDPKHSTVSAISAFKRWGLKTLGELAALPAADLVSRMGRHALAWQAIARGEDVGPLVPTLAEERFESSIELEWPIEDLEPLSFVLTRLLEPLSTRLERRDRGAAVLHVLLRLVTREVYARRLELPSPMRDVRTLRTLALLDLESHPPAAAIDRVTIVIDPTPARVLQHTLFTRAHPTPEQLSTLLARLGALMGHDRFGAAATVDLYRPGAFVMKPFATEHHTSNRGARKERRENVSKPSADSADSAFDRLEPPAPSPEPLTSALRRCRQPVPARVAVADGRPVRVTTDRRGFAGGAVTRCAGPWRTSGDWWNGEAGWDRDEWDVSLSDGAMYRIFQDRENDGWFIDAIVD